MPQYNSGPRGGILAAILRLTSSLSTPAVNATTGTITTVNAGTVDASVTLQAPVLQLDSVATKPTTRSGPGSIKLVKNSTGTTMLAINETGTTWTYIAKTSVLA
jgi:hypothetical protein